MSKNVYDRVVELCESKGISQRKLQRDLDIAIGTITKWKTATPRFDTLQRVADYFNVTTDYLTGKSPYMNQDHMLKCWDEHFGDSTNRPDMMLPDGTILEFQTGKGVTIHSTGGNVEYVYIGPETRKLAEELESNHKMLELVKVISKLPQNKFDTVYDMVMMVNEK